MYVELSLQGACAKLGNSMNVYFQQSESSATTHEVKELFGNVFFINNFLSPVSVSSPMRPREHRVDGDLDAVDEEEPQAHEQLREGVVRVWNEEDVWNQYKCPFCNEVLDKK